MAGDWIKFEIVTPDKPEVWELAEKLDLDPDAVVGKLIRMWIWFNTQTENGHASAVTKKIIDRDVSVTGFCNSVISAGWLSEKDGEISIENFDRHNGSPAKTRALGQKRKARQRHAEVTVKKVLEKRREDNIHTDRRYQVFEELWSIYPGKKGSKQFASKSFIAKIKTEQSLIKIIENLKSRLALPVQDGWQQSSEEYIPHVSTYINKGLWQDDISPPCDDFELAL
tara:strand:- start:746 stop:1423 length:678 start_codon:yes stop_codon:yes gene_type:complete